MTKTRGILLIATGSSYYGNLAANLAASIKATSPNVKIHLVWSDEALTHLSAEKIQLFDTMVECPRECLHRANGKKVFIKPKCHIYDLSPFDETIFLDVDVVACPRKTFEQAFDQLNHLDFTIENRSSVDLANLKSTDVYLWANIDEIKSAYKFTAGKLYGLHSEFIYFKKCDRMQSFFETVKSTFENPMVKTIDFAGDMPDEFAFAIAMIKHDVHPHECPFIPLYWFLTDKNKGSSIEYVVQNYFGYSVGGNRIPENVRKTYDRFSLAYFSKLKISNPYRIKQKRAAIPARQKM